MYLKYFLESGIFAQDSKDSESRTLFYFVTDPSGNVLNGFVHVPTEVPTKRRHCGYLPHVANLKLRHLERAI